MAVPILIWKECGVKLSCHYAHYEDVRGNDGKALVILPIGTRWG